MRKFAFILVLMAALLAACQSRTAEVGTAQYYYEQGDEHFKAGNLDQAITDYNRALEINPRDAEAYNNRGIAYDDKSQHDQAITDFNRALKINPRLAGAYNNRGFAYDLKGQYDQAITDYTMALKIDPRYAEAYSNRGGLPITKKASMTRPGRI